MNLCEEDWSDNIRQPRSRVSQVPHHYVFDDHRRPSKVEKNHKRDNYVMTQSADGVTVDSLTLAKEQFEAKLKLKHSATNKLHASSFDSPKKTIAPKLRVSPRVSPRSSSDKIDEFLPAPPAPMSVMPLVADPAEPCGMEMLLTRSPTRGRRVQRTRSGPRQLPPRRPSHGSAGSGDTPTSIATPPPSSPTRMAGSRSTRSGLSKRMHCTKAPSSPSSFELSFSDSFVSREFGEAFAKPVLAQVDHLLKFDQPFGCASDGASEATPTFSPRPIKRGGASKNLTRARRERSKSRERTRPTTMRASHTATPVVMMEEEIRWDRRIPGVDVARPPTPPKAKGKLLTSARSKKSSSSASRKLHQSWPDSSKRQGQDIFGDDIDQLNVFDDSFSDLITWRRF